MNTFCEIKRSRDECVVRLSHPVQTLRVDPRQLLPTKKNNERLCSHVYEL